MSEYLRKKMNLVGELVAIPADTEENVIKRNSIKEQLALLEIEYSTNSDIN